MSHSTSAAGLSTRSGATGHSDYLSAAPSASGSLPSEIGRAAADAPSVAARGAVIQPTARAAAASPVVGDAQDASAADAAPPAGHPEREAAAAEVADSGAADQPDQSTASAQQEGGAPPAASPAEDEGGATVTGDEEAEKGPCAGSPAPPESQRAEGSGVVREASNGVEAEHSPEWQRQPKHVFVLTSAGAHVFL